MLMIPAPSANVVVPSGTRMNFFSVFVTLGVTAVGGLGLLLAGRWIFKGEMAKARSRRRPQ